MEEAKDNKTSESELLRIQREKYEKVIEDKNKIIKDLLNTPATKKEEKEADEADEDDEEKEKMLEERRKKRMAFYKKNIY